VSPRRSAAAAAQTRAALVSRAAALASTDGLEGVTLGRLATATGVSKSGVVRHFPTKEDLQLETFAHAIERFLMVVWEPVADCGRGLERLRALCGTWTRFLAGETFPGGCFLSAAAAEFDGREGPVRDAVRAALESWLALLAREVEAAVAAGQLRADADSRHVAYQLYALALAANQARQLLGDEQAPARSHALMLDVLAAGSSVP
jgi:AcrR family transcriptional regulator